MILTMCRIHTTIKQRLTCWRNNMDKKIPAILFEDPVKATQFALDYYGEYSQTLTKKEKLLIGTIQSSGLVIGDGRDDSIHAIQKCFSTCPEVPYDIIAWRGGEMSFSKRPFVSASLLKRTAMRYGNGEHDVHKIVIKKGSKIFPLRALDKYYGDEEAEIIIATDCLHWNLFPYRYY